MPYSVHVSGNDVYVVGYERENNTIDVANMWKNGIATPLTDGTYNAKANSVFVLNGDVYTVGYEEGSSNDIAKLWKNGIETSLTDGTYYARASAIFVITY